MFQNLAVVAADTKPDGELGGAIVLIIIFAIVLFATGKHKD